MRHSCVRLTEPPFSGRGLQLSGAGIMPPYGRGSVASRRAFTLLEMVLALSIGVVLLWALYLSMNMQFDSAKAGRNIIQEGTLARSLLTSIAQDILGNLGPVDPKVLPAGSVNGSSLSSTTAPTTSGESGNPSMASGTTTPSGSGQFNIGVRGDQTSLILSVGRVPRELNRTGNLGNGNQTPPLVSDLRLISYWLVPGEGGGLARQELLQVTSDEANNAAILPPDPANPTSFVVAPEVVGLTFEYFDGVTWQTSWDGTELGGADFNTATGAPAAIAITIVLNRPGVTNPENLPTFRHVVAIPAGNNFPLTNQ